MVVPVPLGKTTRPLGATPVDVEACAQLSVSDLAWEFLRRNPQYRSEYWRGLSDVDPSWGLRFPVDPLLSAADADVFWREEIAPGIVLPIMGCWDASVDDTARPRVRGEPRRAEDGLHLRLAAGLQLVFRGRARRSGTKLVVLAFDREFGLRVRAAQALDRAARIDIAPRSRLTVAQRQRLVRSLQALDGVERRDSYRQIAEAIFGADAVAREQWRTASLRDTTIRLVRTGRAMMRGGYLKLLKAGL